MLVSGWGLTFKPGPVGRCCCLVGATLGGKVLGGGVWGTAGRGLKVVTTGGCLNDVLDTNGLKVVVDVVVVVSRSNESSKSSSSLKLGLVRNKSDALMLGETVVVSGTAGLALKLVFDGTAGVALKVETGSLDSDSSSSDS